MGGECGKVYTIDTQLSFNTQLTNLINRMRIYLKKVFDTC